MPAAPDDIPLPADTIPALRVSAHFASLPDFQPPCAGLETHYQAGMSAYLPAVSDAEARREREELDRLLASVRDQSQEVGTRRRAVQQRVRDYMLLSLAVFRARNEGFLAPEVAVQSRNAAQARLLWDLWSLSSAEGELRDSAQAYFDLYARAYRYLDPAARQPVLAWFQEREGCLLESRRAVYVEMHRNWISFLHEATRAAAAGTGGPPPPSPAGLQPDSLPPGLDVLESADAFLDQVARVWGYSWLVPEASLNSHVYRQLLREEEQLLVNGPLFQGLEAAVRANPATTPNQALPGGEEREAVRLEIFRLRARQAAIFLRQRDVLLEAGYAKRLSALHGLLDAGAQLGEDVTRLDELDPNASPYVPWMATAAIAKRFLGSTLDVMVTTPLKDLAVAGARRALGTDWQTGAEKNLEEFLRSREEVTRRIGVLEALAGSVSHEEGMALARWVADGAQGALPSGRLAAFPMTARALLEDPEFYAGTEGGLAHILAILPEDPALRTGLTLRGARFAMTGRTRAGHSRVALDRGSTEPGPEGRVQEKAIMALFRDTVPGALETGSFFETLGANLERVYFSLPVVREVAAVADAYTLITRLPDTIRRSVRFLQGDAGLQEEYLLELVRMEGWGDEVIRRLGTVGFDLGRMARENPADYALHLKLLAASPEWIRAVGEIRSDFWERYKLDILARAEIGGNGRLAPDASVALAMAQDGEEQERVDLAARGGRARLAFDILTFDFTAASAQFRELETLENARLATAGSAARVSYAQAADEAESMALANELAGVYKEVYLATVREVAFSLASAGLANALLGSTLGKEVGEESFDLLGKFGAAFNPWMGKFSAGGVWSTLSGTMVDAIKTGTAQSLDEAQQTYLGERFLTEQEIESALDAVWTLTEEARERGLREATARLGESAVDVYAGTRRYQELLAETRAARTRLASEYDEPVQEALTRFQQAAAGGDAEALRQAEVDLARLNGDGDLAFLRFRYQQAMTELEDASLHRAEIQHRLQTYMVDLPLSGLVKSRILDAAATDPDGFGAGAAAVYGQADLRTRLALGINDLDDLRALVDDGPGGSGLRGNLLTPRLDINLLRGALRAAAARAATAEERAEVTRIAEVMDDERIGQIRLGLQDFMDAHPQYAAQIEAVIQGGAARGNPECQGIFGDIDFTVFLRDDATVNDKELKEALQGFFRRMGYPLAESAERASSMDSEVFVQSWALFDPADAGAVDIIEDLQEKSKDPTRFYSEAGARWFRNNVVYSGVVLWGNQDRGEWQRIEPHEAHALVLDMARYMGFLTDPHLSDEGLRELRVSDPAAHAAALAKFLSKTKYPLRTGDAYLIAHDEGEEGHRGSDLYHARAQTAREAEAGGGEARDASYHEQIARNLESLVAAQAEGRTTTLLRPPDGDFPGDAQIFRWMAEIKLKGLNPNPWQVLDPEGVGESGRPTAAALDRAELMLRRVRELMPEILAYTGARWQEGVERSLGGSDPANRAQALSEVGRTVSTLRNVMDLDDYGASALFAPPDPSIADPQARRAAHTDAIREEMARTLARRQELEADLHEVERTIDPATDPRDRLARAAVDDRLSAREQAVSRLRGQVALEEEAKVLPWIRYLNSLALRALGVGGGR